MNQASPVPLLKAVPGEGGLFAYGLGKRYRKRPVVRNVSVNLRRGEAVLRLVGDMAEQGKVVAAICHGPAVLCSTQALKGRKATCFFAIKDDVVNAGARYTDAEVVRDGNLVTSRKPDDLPAFMQAVIQAVREAKPALAAAR